MSDQVLKAFEEAFGVWTTTGHFKHKPTQHQLDGFRKGYSIAEQASADRIAQLEADLAAAKTAMQEISKLHDHEMSGNEIRMNAYDMACLARKFLSDAAIKEQVK